MSGRYKIPQDQEEARKLAENERIARENNERLDRTSIATEPHPADATAGSSTDSTLDQLQQRVDKLRHEVELRVKADGVPLKSAPFRRSSTIAALPAHTEVVVLIITPYWFGVETADQHHGWIRRSEMEPLP